MDLLDHPEALQLLADADLSAADVRSCAQRLEVFAQRYLPLFHRAEQRPHALTVLRGKLSGLQRKTTEPIATQASQQRRPLQLFVGAGGWDDDAVLAELRRHVAEEIGDPDGVFVLDGSGFPKKGDASCGVARQWCGRLGKVDNCQVGAFLGYAGRRGKALLGARLYLSKDWIADPARRAQTHVPEAVTFQEVWRLALGLLDAAAPVVPGSWVVGDDEFGRCSELRAQLRQDDWLYVLDVPCNTLVREPTERRPPTRPGGKPRLPVFERVEAWVARQPAGRWRTVTVREGAKGPIQVHVLLAMVQAKEDDGCIGARERLVVLRSLEKQPQTWYTLSNARQAKRPVLARVHGARHRIEELLQAGKGEVGLGQYEVRSWVGWHHHMTLSLLALWFLEVERLRLGGKNPSRDRATSPTGVHGTAARTERQRRTDRRGSQPRAAA
ncbi:MAG TPA: IS701 family transposase [Gemmataceae bacterium]|jgi:SRSO17 transposase|nr:IS701 family transposase [Gemmataceae bacterium]